MSNFHKYKYFSSFEAGICVSNSSFQWVKNRNKQFSGTGVNLDEYVTKYPGVHGVNPLLAKDIGWGFDFREFHEDNSQRISRKLLLL